MSVLLCGRGQTVTLLSSVQPSSAPTVETTEDCTTACGRWFSGSVVYPILNICGSGAGCLLQSSALPDSADTADTAHAADRSVDTAQRQHEDKTWIAPVIVILAFIPHKHI